MPSPRAGAFLVAAAASLWGLWPLWIREGRIGGATASCIAFMAAGLVGLPLALAEARRRPRRPAGAWLLLVVLGLADAANSWCYFRALAEGAVAPAVLSHYLAPVILAAVGPAILREARMPRTALALVLALGGTAILVLGASGGDAAAAAATRHALLLGGASAVFYAATAIISKALAPRFGNAELMIFHALVAAAVLAPVVAPLPPVARWGWAVAGGVVSALGGGLLFYAGLRRTPVERAAVMTYIEPVCAVLVAGIVYAEAPPLAALAGGVLVLGAGLITVTAPPRAAR